MQLEYEHPCIMHVIIYVLNNENKMVEIKRHCMEIVRHVVPVEFWSESETWRWSVTGGRFSLLKVKSTLQKSRSHWHSWPGSDFLFPSDDGKFLNAHPVLFAFAQSRRWTEKNKKGVNVSMMGMRSKLPPSLYKKEYLQYHTYAATI